MSTFKHAFRIAALAAIPIALLYTALVLAQATKSIEVLAIVKHPALDAIRNGAKGQLKAEGFGANKSLRRGYQNAQDSTATVTQIARKFISDKPDTIVAIATPSAQVVVATTKSIPVVYLGVTDPVAAQLVGSWAPTGTNVTGMSDKLPLDKQIALIKRVVSNAKCIGMVYSPGEANSVVVITKLKKLLLAQGMMLVESAAPRTVDIVPAAKNLIGKVDMIYTGTDNSMVSAYELLVKMTNGAKTPLVTGNTDSVRRGTITALGINYYKLDQQTSKAVARILKGEKPGTIASAGSSDLGLFVNEGAAKRQGATLSADLLRDAKGVIK